MAKTVPSLILVILVSSAVLLLIWYLLPTTTTVSPFLIMAGIVATVALFGACFSFLLERKKSQPQQS